MSLPIELDLSGDVVQLTGALVDVPSESRGEGPIADLVESALRRLDHLDVIRDGDCVIARTHLGRPSRVVLAGHLDTVPSAGNLPHRIVGEQMFGLGACDMKGGVAVALKAAHAVTNPRQDVTFVFYDCEEIEAAANGLGRIAGHSPDLLTADFAVLLEPTCALVEAGCQGTLRVGVRIQGRRAHSARPWMGSNAIHAAGEVLGRLAHYEPRVVLVDGLEFREGLSAVGITGGVAGNVIPDECLVTVNYRYAPVMTSDEAISHVRDVFTGFSVEVLDHAPGALPGLDQAAAREFLAAVGGSLRPKFGWTDVARFAALGIPAVNFGPGDPSVAHSPDESVALDQLRYCQDRIVSWLSG
ncbi:MAG: succinyl-diaminopimelate desuccinylase [Candidatus Nanopelagicales bacterium]|nr:succinyl-diaminopimelate desuccinylase [Candidatus Nanopelagicales bacterium]MDZ4249606.1 succinyl-diaminopimelate desuccinylase [Candidatus Nanopelagicales bacterium]